MRRRRRNRKWIIPVILLMLVISCGLLLRFVFVVRGVEVTGNSGAVSKESVVRFARLGFGTSILKVDREEIEDRINASGSIKFVDMSIRYPDTVCLEVKVRNREAMMLHMGKIRILDAEAYVMRIMDEVPDLDLVYVSGMNAMSCERGQQIRADEEKIQAYCAVIEALNRHGADIYVSELKLDDVQNMQIITRTGITVNLGNVNKISDKVAWMKSAVADLEYRGEHGGLLDVSSGNKADYSLSAPATG